MPAGFTAGRRFFAMVSQSTDLPEPSATTCNPEICLLALPVIILFPCNDAHPQASYLSLSSAGSEYSSHFHPASL